MFNNKIFNFKNQNKDCYICDKLKHFFKKCIQNKYKNKLSLYDKHDKIITTTEKKEFTQTKHEHMSWTACYKNDYQIYLSDKEKSNWYSKSSRENRNVKQFTIIHRALITHNEFSNDESFTQIQHKKITNEKFEFNELN